MRKPSAEQIERRRRLRRERYTAELERQGKPRTHSSAYFGPLHCSVEGCDQKYYAKGMCNTHYAQEWREAVRADLTRCADCAHIDCVTPETEARLRAAAPAARNKAIIDAHNEGASNRQIAAVVGMSEAGVRRILKENP